MTQPAIPNSEPVTARPMGDEQDFWRMRALLIDTTPITPIGLNWDMRRLGGWVSFRFRWCMLVMIASWRSIQVNVLSTEEQGVLRTVPQ